MTDPSLTADDRGQKMLAELRRLYAKYGEQATADIFETYYQNNAVTPNAQREKLGKPPLDNQFAAHVGDGHSGHRAGRRVFSGSG